MKPTENMFLFSSRVTRGKIGRFVEHLFSPLLVVREGKIERFVEPLTCCTKSIMLKRPNLFKTTSNINLQQHQFCVNDLLTSRTDPVDSNSSSIFLWMLFESNQKHSLKTNSEAWFHSAASTRKNSLHELFMSLIASSMSVLPYRTINKGNSF